MKGAGQHLCFHWVRCTGEGQASWKSLIVSKSLSDFLCPPLISALRNCLIYSSPFCLVEEGFGVTCASVNIRFCSGFAECYQRRKTQNSDQYPEAKRKTKPAQIFRKGK